MTREEAILLLHDMKDTYDEIHENTNFEIGYEQMTALGMAIEALNREQQIIENGYTGKEMRIRIGGKLFAVRELAQ